MKSLCKIINQGLLLVLMLVFAIPLHGQIRVYQTFKDTRIINTPSVETTPHRKLDLRIGHRFGDLAGASGGWESFYGLEQATDVLFGLHYGVTDDLDIGLHRTKGGGPLRQLVSLSAKYRIMAQMDDNSKPLSMVFYGLASASTMRKSQNPEALNNFGQFSHRMSYHASLLLGRKLSEHFSLQFGIGYLHRNLVPFNDENSLISASVATRIQLTKVFGIIADFTLPFSDLRTTSNGYYPPVGIGLEIETGGHVFQVNFTNATGIMETDYIPYTTSNWGDGEFRLGFTISRLFNL